jgi:hypothetical protein
VIHFVLDQLGEIGWKANPMSAASMLIVITYGDAPAPFHPDYTIGNAETVVPDFEFFVASPRDFWVDQSERSGAKIHYDDPLANANLRRGHSAAEATTLAEVVKRRMQMSQLAGEIDIRPRDFGCLLFETRIADCQDGKWLGTHALFWRQPLIARLGYFVILIGIRFAGDAREAHESDLRGTDHPDGLATITVTSSLIALQGGTEPRR